MTYIQLGVPPNAMARLRGTLQENQMKGTDRSRRREACRPPQEDDSLLTTTAALVDTCPYPFVATAEYVAVSSKFALGERKQGGILNALWDCSGSQWPRLEHERSSKATRVT